MKHHLKEMIAFGLCTVLIMLTTIQCGKNKPTAPDHSSSESAVYFINNNGYGDKTLFKYFPGTDAVNDSSFIPWTATRGIRVSADGELLYLCMHDSTVVIETENYSHVTTLPYPNNTRVALSPDNQYLAITNDDLLILRTSDYQVIYSDTDMTKNGVFSSDSKEFFAVCGFQSAIDAYVYHVDLTAGAASVERKSFPLEPIDDFIPLKPIEQIVPSIDNTKWFLNTSFGFEVYVPSLDSFIFQDPRLAWSQGEIALSNDGYFAVYTYPGGFNQPGARGFTIFDIEANAIDMVVDSNQFFTDDSIWLANPSSIFISPDDQWLVMLGGTMALNVLYSYDLQNREMVYRKNYIDAQYGFTHLTGYSSQY